jgi:16S rRNA U516 pseudouridylate synthase RsuA-like enzyme
MKARIQEEEEEVVIDDPELIAELEAAIAEADAGNFVEVEIVDGRLREVRRPR